jgi:hypothetical protein
MVWLQCGQIMLISLIYGLFMSIHDARSGDGLQVKLFQAKFFETHHLEAMP